MQRTMMAIAARTTAVNTLESSSGYEPDELIFRKFLKTRNLRRHNGLAVLFSDHHVDHGDHDDHNLATFWLQWNECASEKIAHPFAACDLGGVSPTVSGEGSNVLSGGTPGRNVQVWTSGRFSSCWMSAKCRSVAGATTLVSVPPISLLVQSTKNLLTPFS
jgi:hypothetical protein